MSLDDYEKHCPLNLFIAQIENLKGNRQIFSTSEDLTDIVAEKNEELTNIGCSVYRGYTYLTARDEENRRYFCDYLNLWLDEQKRIHVKEKNEITDHQWEYIEKIWEGLTQRERDRNRVCIRQKKDKNASEFKKTMNLMVYCVNRIYFKDLCETYINLKTNVNRYCSLFSKFTDKYYTKFYNENQCFDEPLDPDNYGYNVFEDCDLNNMAKTFPKFDTIQEKIVYDESRNPLEQCKHKAKVLDDRSSELATGLEELAVGQGELPKGPDGLDDDHSRPDNRPLGSTDLGLSSLTVVTSPDNKPLKPVYYAGLSVSGVFFTSMVLYKYTALGPLIRSLVSKKEKLRQTTSKHLAQQWLERTSEYMDLNSENANYNFPYQSMQN
ncbi:PIR protein [Plasmodium vivax]|uniref:VIR protein n=1 Tax=Plasmodium vivax TaxID=5855 RepID=A0A565A3X0_PLAVI|nr:PIR protein [Plasmodium vivax]